MEAQARKVQIGNTCTCRHGREFEVAEEVQVVVEEVQVEVEEVQVEVEEVQVEVEEVQVEV